MMHYTTADVDVNYLRQKKEKYVPQITSLQNQIDDLTDQLLSPGMTEEHQQYLRASIKNLQKELGHLEYKWSQYVDPDTIILVDEPDDY